MRGPLAGALILTSALLGACSPGGALKAPGAEAPFDKAKLEAAIDNSFGGVGTCVEILDTASGAEVYRYNTNGVCMRRLPPCSTFKIPNSLIALDAGVATPTTVFKWDRTPQYVSGWEKDADMTAAFKDSILWWYQRVARTVGKPAYEARLKAFHYGSEDPAGPIDAFWLGPAAGGGLGISTREEAQFLHRLYAGKLPVKASSLAFVKSIMVNEARGDVVMSGKTGSCATNSDGSRQVGWWVGRLAGPEDRPDYVFAASIETETGDALPGREVQQRVKSAFVQAGLWPPAT
jgi:beta-lactamase class D